MTTAQITVSPADLPVISQRVSYRSIGTEGFTVYEVDSKPAIER